MNPDHSRIAACENEASSSNAGFCVIQARDGIKTGPVSVTDESSASDFVGWVEPVGEPHQSVVVGLGGTVYIAFNVTATGRLGGTYAKMFHSSLIKAKFGDAVRSKTDTARMNEAPGKVLSHNLCCLIQSSNELGIEATFWNGRVVVLRAMDQNRDKTCMDAWDWLKEQDRPDDCH